MNIPTSQRWPSELVSSSKPEEEDDKLSMTFLEIPGAWSRVRGQRLAFAAKRIYPSRGPIGSTCPTKIGKADFTWE
jgi:hypothetical protein